MDKKNLRLLYKRKRAELDSLKIEELSIEIANQILKLPIWGSITSIYSWEWTIWKKLILITNKRISPTEKMLKNSGIIDFFDDYFSVDPNDISKKDKSILIENTIKDLDINPDSSVYIGDTEGDFIASNTNGIKFIYAGWGYGEYVEQAHLHLNDIRELI